MNQLLPTSMHLNVVEILKEFFERNTAVDTVLLVNSCARSKATPISDLDIAVLVSKGTSADEMIGLEMAWREFANSNDQVQQFCLISPFTTVHLDVINGRYEPQIWDDGGGPDSFELEIGNQIAYGVPISPAGPYFEALKSEWLPYYGTALQAQRAKMVKEACLYDLAYIPYLVERDLLFQAFARLYKAQRTFVQLLMITHRRYPIAYNKWLEEQLSDWLKRPDLFSALGAVLTIEKFDKVVFVQKGELLRALVEQETAVV
ncbi:MAG: nucleotidyltransferase domain-containing protein [Chloroflexota bacterium]